MSPESAPQAKVRVKERCWLDSWLALERVRLCVTQPELRDHRGSEQLAAGAAKGRELVTRGRTGW